MNSTPESCEPAEPVLALSFRVPKALVEDLPAFQAYMTAKAESIHLEALVGPQHE